MPMMLGTCPTLRLSARRGLLFTLMVPIPTPTFFMLLEASPHVSSICAPFLKKKAKCYWLIETKRA